MSGEAPSLLEVSLERRDFEIRVALAWESRALVLFGPSGSGKTSLLRAALGLEPRARVRLRLGGEWLEDADRDWRVPVHGRRLGWVPQSPTLFPDRSVLENVRFGAARDDDSEVARAIDVLELGELIGASVSELSGGERQRVALARAVASRPRALLLDEPLASLDLALRGRVLPFLLRVREELDLPLLHITHDPDEAMLLGDEMAVLDRGRVVAQGEPRETLWSRAVLPLTTQLGVENVLEVEGLGRDGPSRRVRTRRGLELETPWPVEAGAALRIGIRAEDVLIGLDRPGRLSARNVCAGRVASVESSEDQPLVHVDVGDDRLVAKLTQAAVDELALAAGVDVYLIIKSQALRRI